MLKVWPSALLAAGVLLATAGSAQAGVVMCPGTGLGREFSLDTATTASCLTWGTGNINGNGDDVNDLGFVTLDKSDDPSQGSLPGVISFTGGGTTSGTFSIDPSAVPFGPLVLAFKVGEGVLDPDWAAFLLPTGVLSGSWSVSGNQGLSHINLYGGDGGETPPPPTRTPEPTSAILLGSAVLVTRLFKRA